MWISGKEPNILHCQHCVPRLWWVVYKSGEPPQFAYRGFPKNGQVILSKGKVIVVCERCLPPADLSNGDGLQQFASEQLQ